MSLLKDVASFENLLLAYKACRKGKRSTVGDAKFFTNYPERILEIQELLIRGQYEWGQYREFYVTDPKRRLIMAAPFKDRIVHHAIHQIISPFVEMGLTDSVCACRVGKGNRYAVLLLAQYLRENKDKKMYAIKLDVKQYFPSIKHKILFQELLEILPDDSLGPLLWSVIVSHEKYTELGSGIPIGNLTSQLFANLYLSKVDKKACDLLGLKYQWDNLSEVFIKNTFYLRYMDDFLILSEEKSLACKTARSIFLESEERGLIIPIYKRVHLSSDPIPFLGYLVSKEKIIPLARNRRKILRRLNRLEKTDDRDSYKMMVKNSYENWSSLKL